MGFWKCDCYFHGEFIVVFCINVKGADTHYQLDQNHSGWGGSSLHLPCCFLAYSWQWSQERWTIMTTDVTHTLRWWKPLSKPGPGSRVLVRERSSRGYHSAEM